MKNIMVATILMLAASAALAHDEYRGWRDNVAFTGAAGVANAAQAKLHACASGGDAEESTWNGSRTACQSNYLSTGKHQYNDYCADATWDSLCAGWLP